MTIFDNRPFLSITEPGVFLYQGGGGIHRWQPRQPQRRLLLYKYSDLIMQTFFDQQVEIMKKDNHDVGD